MREIRLLASMRYYDIHFFFCCNHRPPDDRSCAEAGSEQLYRYAKDRVKNMSLPDKKRIRINSSGCLGRCDDGPVLVIYPEAAWYACRTQADIDEILEQHLVHGKRAERLLI